MPSPSWSVRERFLRCTRRRAARPRCRAAGRVSGRLWRRRCPGRKMNAPRREEVRPGIAASSPRPKGIDAALPLRLRTSNVRPDRALARRRPRTSRRSPLRREAGQVSRCERLYVPPHGRSRGNYPEPRFPDAPLATDATARPVSCPVSSHVTPAWHAPRRPRWQCPEAGPGSGRLSGWGSPSCPAWSGMT